MWSDGSTTMNGDTLVVIVGGAEHGWAGPSDTGVEISIATGKGDFSFIGLTTVEFEDSSI
jgi:hypothetical protein